MTALWNSLLSWCVRLRKPFVFDDGAYSSPYILWRIYSQLSWEAANKRWQEELLAHPELPEQYRRYREMMLSYSKLHAWDFYPPWPGIRPHD